MLLEPAFHLRFCLKFSFKLVTFSKSYASKQEWIFFLNTVYIIVIIMIIITNIDLPTVFGSTQRM